MVISKNDELFKILKEFIKDAKTPECSTIVASTNFWAEKGILFKFSNGIEKVYWCDKSISETFSIEGSFFITVLLSELEKGKDINIVKSDGGNKVIVNDVFAFDICVVSCNWHDESREEQISFTKEQFDNLEKDFVYTSGNYFLNPKTTEVIGIACNQGDIYKLLPSISAYKISKLDATIDKVTISQNFGHETKIWLIPKKVFDIVRGSSVGIKLFEDRLIFFANNIILKYNINHFGTDVFLTRLKSINKTPDKSFISLKSLKAIDFSPFVDKAFWGEEDKNVSIKIENKVAKITIDNCEFLAHVDEKDFELCTNTTVLAFLLSNVSDDATIGNVKDKNGEELYMYLVIDKDGIIFIPKTNYLD